MGSAGQRYRPASALRLGDDGSMVQSVELLLDAASDAWVRDTWRRLADSGLPSQENHRSDTNRPHITLAARTVVTLEQDDALSRIVEDLPIPATLGALAVFGDVRSRRGLVLVRSVVADAALLALHRRVAYLLGPDDDSARHFGVGAWTPHVTLGHGFDADQAGAALGLLADGSTMTAQLSQVRRWDGVRRHTWVLRDPMLPP